MLHLATLNASQSQLVMASSTQAHEPVQPESIDIYSSICAVDRSHYAASLLSVYVSVTSHGSPNICRARIAVPTNLDLRE